MIHRTEVNKLSINGPQYIVYTLESCKDIDASYIFYTNTYILCLLYYWIMSFIEQLNGHHRYDSEDIYEQLLVIDYLLIFIVKQYDSCLTKHFI